jgi:hypothetical protein
MKTKDFIYCMIIGILLAFALNKPDPLYIRENKYIEVYKSDSLKYQKRIDSLSKAIRLIDKKRKDERTNYEREIAKLSAITHDSVFSNINDSIKAMLRSMR